MSFTIVHGAGDATRHICFCCYRKLLGLSWIPIRGACAPALLCGRLTAFFAFYPCACASGFCLTHWFGVLNPAINRAIRG